MSQFSSEQGAAHRAHHQGHQQCRENIATRHAAPECPQSGLWSKAVWMLRYLGFIVFRNRFAIAIASLVWLVWRSGTQPRRLAYPCQQAAAANLGFLAVLFIPEAARRHAARNGTLRRAVGLATGSVALAGVLFLLVAEGGRLYSYIVTGSYPTIPAPSVMPPAATVGIVKTTKAVNTLTDLDVEAMVRAAVAKAGGLSTIITPGQSVAIKPNLVNDNTWLATAPTGVTTDPRVVAAVVKMAKEAGAGTIRIIEGTAGPSDWGGGYMGRDITKYAFYNCGYSTTLGGTTFKYDSTVTLVDINDAGGVVTNYASLDPLNPPTNMIYVDLGNSGMVRHGYFIHKAVLKPSQHTNSVYGLSDVLITVPTLKNHGNAGMTAALKSHVGIAPSDIYHAVQYTGWDPHYNQMKIAGVHWSSGQKAGINPPFPRATDFPNDGLHPNPGTDENTNVHYSIVDLNLVRANSFAVVDGLIGITDGPVGNATKIGGSDWTAMSAIILAGKDSVAIDSVATLCEGYDPLNSLQLGWSWNRGLGNRDTTQITVLGDHTMAVRKDYPADYGGSVRADSTVPTLTGLVPADGATVSGNVIFTASGASDVAKAELSVKLTGGTPNVITNGDFEQGSTGWTAWSGWGSGIVRDFNDATSGSGKCLHMTCTDGSFGVYQEVTVTPGKTYKIDGYWKGQKLSTNGANNWYEVLLLDGPWDQGQADGNPNTFPYTDPSEPVFNEMYGYDSHTYTMTSDFGWEWLHSKNGTPVDTIWRNGVRKATGNKMTVALKVGAISPATGGSGWFDSLTLTECVEETIVATAVSPPTPTFNITWPSLTYTNGNYDVKLTVYDMALNEASITRHVIKTDILAPQFSVAPTSISRTMLVGGPLLTDTITVANVGIGTLNFSATSSNPSAISVSPPSGSTTGPAVPLTVSYAALPPGTYTANITISDNGSTPLPPSNGPIIVPVTLVVNPFKADFDRDSDVDQSDFGFIQACLTGQMVHYTNPACAPADLSGDGDIDDGDVSQFMACFYGPNTLPPSSCQP